MNANGWLSTHPQHQNQSSPHTDGKRLANRLHAPGTPALFQAVVNTETKHWQTKYYESVDDSKQWMSGNQELADSLRSWIYRDDLMSLNSLCCEKMGCWSSYLSVTPNFTYIGRIRSDSYLVSQNRVQILVLPTCASALTLLSLSPVCMCVGQRLRLGLSSMTFNLTF